MLLEDRVELTEEVKQRIIENIVIDDVSGCWNWTKRLDVYGYGKISIRRREKKSHGNKTHTSEIVSKVAYVLWNGSIPEGMVIRHTCDNRTCCNPEHLLIGTVKQNALDAVERNRLSIPKRNTSNYSRVALNRKRKYKEDGSWTWEYPEDFKLIKDEPFNYKRYLK